MPFRRLQGLGGGCTHRLACQKARAAAGAVGQVEELAVEVDAVVEEEVVAHVEKKS